MKEIQKKLRRKISKLSNKLLTSFLCISFFLLLLSTYDKDVLKKIPIYDIAEWVTTIEQLAAPILLLFDYFIVKILVWIIFGISLVLLFCKVILRPRAIVINHSTFSNTQSSWDENIALGLTIKQRDINLVDFMKNNDVLGAVYTQDRLIDRILRDCDEYTELFYYGIAHIPLIFRAGFQIGDEGKVRLMHKYRNGQFVFKEISLEDDDFTVELKVDHTSWDNTSNEMLLVVATSFPISHEDLEIFKKSGIGHELRFEMNKQSMYGVDSVVSYAVMNRLRIGILNQVRMIVSSANIERIHLVLSTSSDFAFFLSQGISKYHDPEIIVYQYERSNPLKYPWGISNRALPESAIIWQKMPV